MLPPIQSLNGFIEIVGDFSGDAEHHALTDALHTCYGLLSDAGRATFLAALPQIIEESKNVTY